MAKKPILYLTIPSPPVRSVLLTAKAIGVELDLKELDLKAGEHLSPEFLKINPQHTVPTLDDNGTIVYESHVICGYLVDKYGKNDKLYPKDYLKRIDVQAKLHFDNGFVFARLRFLFEPIIFFGSKEWPTEKIEYIQRTYEIMERMLQDHPYVCDDDMTIADLCLTASFSTIEDFAPIDKDQYPKFTAWLERMKQLPYYEEANGKGAEACKGLVRDCLEKNRAK